MKKIIRPLTLLRKISQCVFLGLLAYVLWATAYPLKLPVATEAVFWFDPFIVFLVSVCERMILPGFLWALLMVGLTFIFGRFFCGWICPFGSIQDMIRWVLPCRQRSLSDVQNVHLRRYKFYILGLLAILSAFTFQAVWIFDPIVIAVRFISLNLIPAVTWSCDSLFIFIIKTFRLYHSPFYDFYRAAKTSVLGVRTTYYPNSGVIFGFFLGIVGVSFFLSRAWCRILCPLGALYAMNSAPALLERNNEGCVKCGICSRHCRVGAIRGDFSYVKSECILCMDCVYDCQKGRTKFLWRAKKKSDGAPPVHGSLLRRSDFLKVLLLPFLTFMLSGFGFKRTVRASKRSVIRPPGALKEEEFIDRCVRCGNCMKVCPTNGLQPVFWESGVEGLWTPQLVPEIGCCEYNCTLCGQVCPTQAITKLPLSVKKTVKLGLAEVDRKICVAWAQNKECLVCEEHCPISTKAIKIDETTIVGKRIGRPVVDAVTCIGCGLCQHVCPVSPVRAIRVMK